MLLSGACRQTKRPCGGSCGACLPQEGSRGESGELLHVCAGHEQLRGEGGGRRLTTEVVEVLEGVAQAHDAGDDVDGESTDISSSARPEHDEHWH